MRLHRLQVTAFGPFASTVEVDFDRLSDAGLFLFSGPTGAGKTSVLDAVCFALYGDVPGDRSTAKRLRSDQAAAGTRPRVELEATLAGRRFRLVRSPAWERPKKRGSGTTTEQASVVISERTGGDWVTHSTRLDETGHLVGELLGMTLTQFTQVAMLPQGRFQAFLRARSEERQALLQQLFRTQRFADVERWLRERRQELRKASEGAHQAVADVVSRLSEAAGVTLPDDWEAGGLALPACDGSISRWAESLAASATATAHDAAEEAHVAGAREQQARVALDAGRELAAARSRVVAARDERERLLARSADHERALARIEAARRAAGVVPIHRVAQQAASALRGAAEGVDTTADREVVAAAVQRLTDDVAATRALLPQEARAAELRRLLQHTRADLTTAEQRHDETRRTAEELPGRVAELREDVDRARSAEERLGELRSRLEALQSVRRLAGQLETARELHVQAREEAVAAREHLIEIRTTRLQHMAAELAGSLAVGAGCPVCGSCDHPHKAAPVQGAPDDGSERAAQRAADDAAAAEHVRGLAVRDLTTRLELARQQAGDADEATVREELTGLAELAGRRGRLQAELVSAEERVAGSADALARAQAQVATLRARATDLGDELRLITEQVRAWLSDSDSDADSLGGLLDHLGAALDRARDQLRRLDVWRSADEAHTQAREALVTACAEAGFASVADMLTQVLDPADLAELEEQVQRHRDGLAAASRVLDEPGAAALLDAEVPDLQALAVDHADALALLSTSTGRATSARARADRLSALVVDLERELAAWAPLRADLELTAAVSGFVEGKHPDNHLQMRLSAYVVAYRLTQVVAAANERLARMSDQRYSLEHTVQRGAGETRGGLSLLVRDDWSGESRDPATLSGGETFVVSLALALGLADVITQEAGGAELDTLFVDEGFGSLDADTLDDVMDVLDSLRDGGRVVGVVSHVAEMRDRIPTQLVLSKGRTGSTLSVVGHS